NGAKSSANGAHATSHTQVPHRLLTLLHVRGSGTYHSRSELTFAFITGAIRAQIADEEIIRACLDPQFAGCGIYDEVQQKVGRKYAERQVRQAHEEIAQTKPAHLASWEAPDLSILDDRRGELPEFPLNIFSPEWRETISRIAHGAGVTVTHVAVPLLATASS